MSQPPTGAEGYPPQPPPGTTYGAGQPVPQQYGGSPPATPQYGGGQPATPQYGSAQPEPTLPRPVPPMSDPPAPGQYAPGSAPVSAPGYPQPMSAPPVSGPGYPQPMSPPPVSGAGYPQPMSAPPGAVPPYGAPAAGARKGRSTLILALVAGLLFVLGGVATGLYVTTNGKLHRTEQKVSQREGTITANQQEIEKLKVDLQAARDKLADAQQDLTGTKNDRDEQARQKKVIANCLDKLIAASEAAAAGNKAAFDKATKGLNKICDEAENYL
ncbi:hypothetical protein [Micromonospora sp. SL4-19]|uniref:hypothetical protein n=1 Tax=Micromonospora sp. SL4-19 TaxID=3399129 RepID=UPI003A4E2C7C